MEIIPKKFQPYATRFHRVTMWMGATLIAYGILALIISLALVTIKIEKLPEFFRWIPFSMIATLFLGLLFVFVASSELSYKYYKANPSPED